MKRGQSKYMPHMRAKAAPQPRTYSVSNQNAPSSVPPEHIPQPRGHYAILRSDAEMATKGTFGGLCNRSACLRHDAYWWNRGSYAYYCEDCAYLINKEFRHRDDVENYGSLLVQPPQDVDVVDLAAIYGDIERRELWSDKHPKPWCIEYSTGIRVYFDTEEEATGAQMRYRRVTGLREDGSKPLWFIELSKRYEELRTQVTIKASR